MKRTYFGLASLVCAIISVLFLAGFFGITILNITPNTFFTLNNLMAFVYCIMTPLAGFLGLWGFTRKNDSRVQSTIALGLIGLPFLVLLWQFVNYFLNYQE